MANQEKPALLDDSWHAPLLQLWRKFLKIENVSIDDDLFEKGGDSLMAIDLWLEPQQLTGRQLPDSIVFETALAYHRTAALTAAVKLDIFSLIGAGSTTVDALALKTDASPRGLRILCDYLTVIGLLQKQDFNYNLTPAAGRFLDRSSPLVLGGCVDFLAAPEMLALVLDDPVSYVRRGGSDGLTVIAPDHPIWVRFARAMAPFAAPGARRVAAYVATLPESPHTVLDIAAGHGLYGIEVAKAVPTAVVTAVDWAEVLAIAQENAKAAGVDDRFRTVVGSAFDVEWGGGFDLVLLPNILHYFDRDKCVAL